MVLKPMIVMKMKMRTMNMMIHVNTPFTRFFKIVDMAPDGPAARNGKVCLTETMSPEPRTLHHIL